MKTLTADERYRAMLAEIAQRDWPEVLKDRARLALVRIYLDDRADGLRPAYVTCDGCGHDVEVGYACNICAVGGPEAAGLIPPQPHTEE